MNKILVFSLLFYSTLSLAQSKTIKSVVFDEKEKSLESPDVIAKPYNNKPYNNNQLKATRFVKILLKISYF